MSCETSSKPPVCSSSVVGRTAKGTIYVYVVAKVIFSISSPLPEIIDTTCLMSAVNVNHVLRILPPCGRTILAIMTTDIYVFYFLTTMCSQESHDVKIYEFSSDVINIVNTMGWKAAGRSPVSGLVTKVIHHA